MEGLQMKYFVLKPKGKDEYAQASRLAMRAYANAVQGVNPELTKQLRQWADSETPPVSEDYMKNTRLAE